MIIAMAGKGGVGKSTMSAQLIKVLSKKGLVLAVDADPNSNLGEKLGLETYGTIGGIRNELVADPDKVPASVSKQEYISNRVMQTLSEGDNIDLLIMGRPEGEGCYCFVNDVLRSCFAEIVPRYKYAVVDNEAGMEHISRGILPKVDTVILVSDASRRGIQACGRIFELVKELKLGAKQVKLLVNRAPGGVLSDGVMEEIKNTGMDLLAVLPQDETIYEFDGEGTPTSQLPADNPFRKALYAALDQLTF